MKYVPSTITAAMLLYMLQHEGTPFVLKLLALVGLIVVSVSVCAIYERSNS